MIQEAPAAAVRGGMTKGILSLIISLLPFVIFLLGIIALIVIIIIDNNKKKKKQQQYINMLNTLRVGDQVVTYSGMVGTIIQIEVADVLIELGTGNAKSQVKILKSAISANLTPHA